MARLSRLPGLVVTWVLFVAAAAHAQDPAPPVQAAPSKLPEVLHAPPPEYPAEATKLGLEGEVHLRVHIDATGAVLRVDVVDGVHPLLDWAALGAATQMVFSPAELDGRPVEALVDFRLEFAQPTLEEALPPADVLVSPPTPDVEAVAVSPGVLRGRVRVAGTALPLGGAEVAVVPEDAEGNGDEANVLLFFSDGDGLFTARLAPGRYRLEVAAFGYEPVIVRADVASGATVSLNVSIATDVGDPFETVVRGRRRGPAVSRVTLSRDEVRAIPGTFGDPIRVIDSLPGSARTPLLGGGLILRGGMPGDSRIFFDGVEIPTVFHWGGLASIVNAAFMEELIFYPGGFPVEYGRATAGIVDIRSHALDLDAFVGSIDIDSTDIGFFLGGPVQVGDLPKVSFGFAARRSYLEGMGTLFLQSMALLGVPLEFLPVPRYWDFQGKVQTRPLPGHNLALTVFGSDDRFTILGENLEIADFGTETLTLEELLNNVVANEMLRVILEHEVRLAPGVSNTFRPWVGTTRRSILAGNLVVDLFSGGALSTPQRQLNWGARDELRLRMTDELTAVAGIEHIGKTFALELGAPFADPEFDCPDDPGRAAGCIEAYKVDGVQLSTAAYARMEIGPFAGVSLHPGVRVESFHLAYEDQYGHITDGGVAPNDRLTVDPRVAARWELFPSLAFKGSVGWYQRAPDLDVSVMDNDGAALVPIRAWQAIAGFEHLFSPDLELDVQLYGIGRDRLVEDVAKAYSPATGRAALFNNVLLTPSSFTNDGTGGTVGVELMLRHQPNRFFFGWVAYTFSRTWMDVGEERDRYHPAPFDQTHNIVLVGRANLPWGFTLGGRFQYTTGNPSPIPGTIAVVHDLGGTGTLYQPIEDPGHRPRVPDFHRFDVRLDKKFTFDSFSLGAYLEVMNLYNRLNPEVIGPGGDFRSRGTVTLLPSVPFLPTIGMSGSF